MPIVGFIDADDQRLTWKQIHAGEGTFFTTAGAPVPRPVVRACARGYREADHYGDPRTVSVTTIISPAQQKTLELRHDLYVRPLDNLWAVFGTFIHGLLEANPGAGDITEQKLVVEHEGMLIGGTFDRLLPNADTYTGQDWKITSVYKGKKWAKEGVTWEDDYFWQANIYAWLIQHPDVMTVDGKPWIHSNAITLDGWEICAVFRDWTLRAAAHIGPMEVFPVKLLEPERVENYLNQRIMVWKAAQLQDDEHLVACTPAETWDGRRCLDYCASNPVCHQAHPELELGQGAWQL